MTVEQLNTESFIAHYGVKGMKWGVNRSAVKGALGQRTEAVGKPSKEAKATAKTHSKAKSQKSLQALSNKEIKDALERMRLEQQYSQMTGGIDKTSQQKASGFVRDLVRSSGKQQFQQFANEQVKAQMQSASKNANKNAGKKS